MRLPWDPLVDEAGRPGLTLGELLIVFLVGVLAFVTAAPALGQAQERQARTLDCRQFATQIVLAAWARDMKADENLVAIFYRTELQHLGDGMARAVEREVRRLWHEKKPASVAVGAAHLRCVETLGLLGADG